MIIAVDGPAASGKGTLARRLARHYGLSYLDTGALYRAVALTLLRAGKPPSERRAAARAAANLDPALLTDPELRTDPVGEAASIVAAMPEVRAAILELQQAVAHRQPGAVLDGRDIGTVVCPDADVKLFVTASPEIRAERRRKELVARREPAPLEEVLETIRQRDARDQTRAVAPLRRARDAHLLDTTDLDIEAAFQAAVAIIDRRK